MCHTALAAAERREEKSLAVEALGRVGTAPAMALAASLLDDKDLQAAAGAAVVALSDSVVAASPEETEKTLAKVLAQTTDPTAESEGRKTTGQGPRSRRTAARGVAFRAAVRRPHAGGLGGRPRRLSRGRRRDRRRKSEKGGRRRQRFSVHHAEFGDFELRLQVRLLGDDPNGGVNFRSRRDPSNGVAVGYQADLGQSFWGCLYDEARRNRVIAAASPTPTIDAGRWNDYRIRCEGRRIRLWVNGAPTVDYTETDANIPTSGILAVQVQAGRPCEAWYRNLRIRELAKTAK